MYILLRVMLVYVVAGDVNVSIYDYNNFAAYNDRGVGNGCY